VTVPTTVFLSLPVHTLSMEIMGIHFMYHYATTHITYSLYAGAILIFFTYSIWRIALCKNPLVSRKYGIMAFLPSVIGGANDFSVTHGLIENIMLSEYLVFGFCISVFLLFLREERQAQETIRRLNIHLDDEVKKKTEKLTETISMLNLENEERKRAEQEREKVIKELQSALKDIKTLSGLLPICASCKKIRDDKGYWNQLEQYIHEHSQANFTHSLCPECAKKLYPEFYTKKDN